MDSAYIQDQWKLQDNLTLNYGLRYDLSFPPIITNSAILTPITPNWTSTTARLNCKTMRQRVVVPRFAPCIPGGTYQHMSSFLPIRASFSLRIKTIGRRAWGSVLVGPVPNTVFHAGYGRSYDNWAGVEQTAQNVNGWLILSSISLANLNQPRTVTTPGTQNDCREPNGRLCWEYSTGNALGRHAAGSYNSPPQFIAPHLDQWNVGVQQKVGALGVWTVNYVGSSGRNIDLSIEANTAPPGPRAVAPRTQFPYMLQAHWDIPVNKMDYEALETNFQGRSAKTGFTYVVSYTISLTPLTSVGTIYTE